MQKVDTAELRRLWEAATKGEWRCFRYSVASASLMVGDIVCQPPDGDCEQSLEKWPHNAEFIAAAHNALPALLDELEAAREENERLTDCIFQGEGIDAAGELGVTREGLTEWLDARDRRMKLIGAAEELRKWTNGSRNREIKHYDTYYRGVHDEMAAWLRELNERAAELEAAAREGEETK